MNEEGQTVLWVACCTQCTFKGKPMDSRDLYMMRTFIALGHIFCPVCEGSQWRYETITIVEETSQDEKRP